MGLSYNDAIPKGISLREAYVAIRSWYRNNTFELKTRDDEYAKASLALIKALPAVTSLSELEIRAIFAEVIAGYLEWAYHRSDGKYKMAAYVHGALETASYDLFLSEEEKKHLRESRLWPYLSDHLKGLR